MAMCGHCGRDVGCSCNLLAGLCPGCYNLSLSDPEVKKRKLAKYIPPPTTPPDPNNEFTKVLEEGKGLPKEELLRRINEIIEQAKDNYYNGNSNT